MAEKKNNEIDRYLIVTEPVADLQREPVDFAGGRDQNNLQETQLLLNEVLAYRGENDTWFQVEAIEQTDFSREDLWRGYPGWVRKRFVREVEKVKRNNVVIRAKVAHVYKESDRKSKAIMTVSIGTRFHATEEINGSYRKIALPDSDIGWIRKRDTRDMAQKMSERLLRRGIVSTAKLFTDVPYLWGGRSIKSEVRGQRSEVRRNSKLAGIASGVDCSGLTNLVFRANNVDIPRNAHVQWMVTPKITHDVMQPGDLFFVSNVGEFYKICHVMVYLGGDAFIEASEADAVVKIDTFRNKFGKTLSLLAEQGLTADNRKIYCGKMPVSK